MSYVPPALQVERAGNAEADRGDVVAEQLGDRRLELRDERSPATRVGVGRSCRRTTSPSRVTTPARIFVPPRSTPMA